MKVLFICKGELRYSYPPIAAELRRAYGWDVDAVTFNTPSVAVVREAGGFATVYNLAGHLRQFYRQHGFADCLARLAALETADGVCAHTLIYADRILREYPYERAVRLLAGVADFWATVLAAAAPDAVYGEIANASEWLLTVICRRMGVRFLAPYPTPVPDKMYFIDDPKGDWGPMKQAYFALRDKTLSPDRARRAEQWLDAFHRSKAKPAYFQAGLRSHLRFHPGRFARRVGRIPFRVSTYLQDGFYEIGSYHGTNPLMSVWANVRSIYRNTLANALIFRSRRTAGRYVYFPLHVQPEYTTDIRAPYFTNQIGLVETMAKTLPIGYRLLVKEHPGMRGERPVGYYRELQELFNVEFLSPDVDSHDLIRGAAAVVTITGTTAWEAIVYEKPVVVFGDLCYGFYDLIYHCPDVRDFREVIRRALTEFKPDRALLRTFVSALLETAHEATVGDAIRSPDATGPAAVEKLARAVVRELGRDRRAVAEPVTS